MPIFEYRAKNQSGQAVSGTLFCATLAAAVDDLTRRGFVLEHVEAAPDLTAPAQDLSTTQLFQSGSNDLYPDAATVAPAAAMPYSQPVYQPAPSEVHNLQSEVPAQGFVPTQNVYVPRSRVMTDVIGPLISVKLSDLLFFFRQLGTMLNAGVGVVQSLDTLMTQTSDPKLREAIREFKARAQEGKPLTSGMERYPDVFTPLMISLVRAGEEIGRIDESLKLVARHIEQEIEIRNLFKRVTFYPKLVLVVSIVIILAANGVLAMLGKGPALSSPLTQLFTWLILGPLIILTFLFFRVGVRQPGIREHYDKFTQMIPYLGRTLHQFAMAKFGRAFGTLYRGGVPIGKSVQLAADSSGNEHLRKLIYPCAKQIEEGAGIAESFARTGAFSPIVLDMVSTGETTGKIDEMMDTLANFYEDEAQTRMTQSGHLFGVVIFLIVAVYVAYVVITSWMNYASGFAPMMEGVE